MTRSEITKQQITELMQAVPKAEEVDALRADVERLRADELRLTRERDEALAERNVAIAVVVASYAAMWACTALWSMP